MTRFSRAGRILGQSALAVALTGAIAYAQPATTPQFPSHAQVPISVENWQRLKNNPQELNSILSRPAPVVPRAQPSLTPAPTVWQALPPLPQGNAANPLLLNDGTVIVHQDSTPYWWKLTPDINGSYVNGTWSKIGRMPSNYGPRFFGSQVLPDGRVIVEGGEYNFFNAVWTKQGAIYNPNFGAWINVNPPPGWTQIGDAQAIVLDNGTDMQADCCDVPPKAALLNAASLTWAATGNNKFDVYDEEGWTLLPDGNVLTVDAYVFTGTCGMNSEIYDSAAGTWTSAGSTIVQLPDCNSNFPSFEMGPHVLRPDGTVVAFGATTTGTAHTAIFTTSTGTWAKGPDLPVLSGVPYTLADAPAALEPNGNILFAASPGNWTSSEEFPRPTLFFEFSPTNGITQVANNPDGSFLSSFQYNFLVLPTGQILTVETDTPNVWVYNPTPGTCTGCAPAVTGAPAVMARAHTYALTGTQFNGLSEGSYYGDDVQGSTDRPIVAIVNTATGHVFYQRTSGYTISLAPNAPSSTNVTITGATETGASTLYVIANGIPSAGVSVTVQ